MYQTIQESINKFLISLLPEEYSKKIDQLKFSEDTNSGYNKWGFRKDSLKAGAALMFPLYKNYFKVTCHGIENIPEKGSAILVSNHSGQLPFDAAMIVAGVLFESRVPRLVRTLVEKEISRISHLSMLLSRTGQICGNPEVLEEVLNNDEIALIFPEGKRGIGKVYKEKYQIKKFTKDAVQLAIRCKSPVIPTVVIGAEEQIISLYNAESIAKALNLPYFPITPTFPWLGILGLIPFPSKYDIYFGEPINYSQEFDLKGATDMDLISLISQLTRELQEKVQGMVNEGLKKREK